MCSPKCIWNEYKRTGAWVCMLPVCPYKAVKRGGDWMAHDYARTFYKSKAWARCRASYIAERQGIDGGLCERCHKALGYIVHHKVHITPANISNPDVTLNHDNLQYAWQALHTYCRLS